MGKEVSVGIEIKYISLLKKQLLKKIFFSFYIDKTKPKKYKFFLSEKSIQAYVKKKFLKNIIKVGVKLSKISMLKKRLQFFFYLKNLFRHISKNAIKNKFINVGVKLSKISMLNEIFFCQD